jgi:membrane-associated phospholipid phosphatase
MSGRLQRIRSTHAFAVAREIAVIAVAALVYFGVRGLTESRIDRAFENADRLLRLERSLGIAWERGLQQFILDERFLVTATNWIYVYGHWPVILGCGVFLYVRHRREYRLLRDAMFISGLIGFAFFAALPVAPPRFVDPTVVDTVTQYSHGYRALQPPALTNQYAALPSLHAGWNLLVGILLFQVTTSVALRAFAVAMPVAMAFAVVATANHFVLDVVLGTIVVLIGLAFATRVVPRTMDASDRPRSRTERSAWSPVRRRARVRELHPRVAGSRGARRTGDRGRRAPLSRAVGGAPSEDARPDSTLVGSLEACESIRASAPRR